MNLGTKAENITRLKEILRNAKTLDGFVFTYEEWIENSDNCWNQSKLLGSNLIVRSSCLAEDRYDMSNAGKYISLLNINTRDRFYDAVNQVFCSYTLDERPIDIRDQILVQPMLENVAVCGVAFTLDPNNGGNYYVINYDYSGATDRITSGSGKDNLLFYQFKYSDDVMANSCAEGFLLKLIATLRELEEVFEKNNLDVEFAVDSKGELYIFQVRELCMKIPHADVNIQTDVLKGIHQKLKEGQKKKPFLCGDRAIYSVMTDWNPAEMIGLYPKALALSLYREIITDSVWAYQRDNYGYRNLRSFPLLVDFGGIPYIDVRVSFNSFVPAGLDEKISEKLVNYYLNRLVEHPSEHDKAEFNIVFSCYTFDLPERILILKDYGFSSDEIEKITDALRNVTNQIIDHEKGLWRKDYAKIEKLRDRYDEIITSDLSDVEKTYWLLEDCKRYGTLPFAGLARGAFVAVQLLKSMINVGVLSQNDYDAFMNDVNSVSSQMNSDFRELQREAFLEKYGHLRPGTYDITIPRYDEDPDRYFDWKNGTTGKGEKEVSSFRLSMEQMHLLREQVVKSGLNNDILELLDFIKKVIEGREYGKFIFTRNLSKALQLIGQMGEKMGLTRDDMAYMDVHTIYELYSSSRDMEAVIKSSIQKGEEDHRIKTSLRLPPIIIEPEEVFSFFYPDSEPNFVTLGKVSGGIVDIKDVRRGDSFEGKILMIPSADPGYDWIFSHGVSGFITMYGGANSHMAIRAGELGIPAVIGAGEKLYEKYSMARAVEINAGVRQVTILK